MTAIIDERIVEVLKSIQTRLDTQDRDRRVFATDQLTAEEIAPFEGAKMHPRHDVLDAELEGWEP
jgi:hypothetical protein